MVTPAGDSSCPFWRGRLRQRVDHRVRSTRSDRHGNHGQVPFGIAVHEVYDHRRSAAVDFPLRWLGWKWNCTSGNRTPPTVSVLPLSTSTWMLWPLSMIWSAVGRYANASGGEVSCAPRRPSRCRSAIATFRSRISPANAPDRWLPSRTNAEHARLPQQQEMRARRARHRASIYASSARRSLIDVRRIAHHPSITVSRVPGPPERRLAGVTPTTLPGLRTV